MDKSGNKKKSEKRFRGALRRMLPALAAFGWVLASAVIIASAHTALHLQKVSAASLGEALALFFIPLACTFIQPFLAKVDDIRTAIYMGFLSGIIAMAIIVAALYSPSMFGTVEFWPDYNAFVIKSIMISALGILPAVVVGSTIGGAIATW